MDVTPRAIARVMGNETQNPNRSCRTPGAPACRGIFDVGQKRSRLRTVVLQVSRVLMQVEVEKKKDGRWIAEVSSLRGAMA